MILYWVFLLDDTLIKVMIILKPLQTGSYINIYTEEKIMTCFICLWSIMDIWPGKFKICQQFNTIICCGTINCLSVNLFMFFWNKLLLSVLFSFLLFVKIQTKPKMNQPFFKIHNKRIQLMKFFKIRTKPNGIWHVWRQKEKQ